jgi:hypothetical protein
MNPNKCMCTFVFAIIFMLSFQVIAQTSDGIGHGGGGDQYALEFVTYGTAIAGLLKNTQAAKHFPEIDIVKFEKALSKTRVETVEQLFLGSVEVDAINYPDSNLIQLNRKRWAMLQEQDPSRFYALVLHEYLGILRIDDSNYILSSSFNNWIKNQGFPTKNGRARYHIYKVSVDNPHTELKQTEVCHGALNFIASFADTYASIDCVSQLNNQLVNINLIVGALLAGDGYAAWPKEYKKQVVSYMAALEFTGKLPYDVYKMHNVGKTVHSTKLSGNQLVLPLQTDYVATKLVICSTAQCLKPGEPREMFYAMVEVLD